MKRMILKDIARRNYYRRSELRRKISKFFFRSDFVSQDMKRKLAMKATCFLRNASLTRIKNRCLITGRARGISRQFRLSRISLRQLAAKGHLNGIYKSSW